MTRPTDDVAGPAFYPNTKVGWGTYLASYAWDEVDDPGKEHEFVDRCLREGEFSTLDPFDFEETCDDDAVVAVVDVGVELAIPVAICSRERQGGGRVWWWRVCSSERRRS